MAKFQFLVAAVAMLAATLYLTACSPERFDEHDGDFITELGMLGPDGGKREPAGMPTALTVTGIATAMRYLPTAVGLGGYRVVDVCPGVTVEAVRWTANQDVHDVVGATTADVNGRFTLNFITEEDYFIRVLADADYGVNTRVIATTGAPLAVAANGTKTVQSSVEIPYAVCSPLLHRADGDQDITINADLELPYMRGGAFSILGTLRRCLQAVETAGALGDLPQELEVIWAPGNIGQPFLYTGGPITQVRQITGTQFLESGKPTILVSGGDPDAVETSDHDEFDDAVLAHEFSHFLIRSLSSDQNWGGPHNGEALVPGAAYGEGLPTALGCALLGDGMYIDTIGLPPQSDVLVSFDVEHPSLVPGVNGYTSELSVMAVGWDILDGGFSLPSTDGDPAQVALPAFFVSLAALAGRDAPYDVPYLASLLQQLIDDGWLTLSQADLLMQSQGAAFPATGTDLWPDAIGLPDSISGSLDASTGPGGTPPNKVLGANANAAYRLELSGAQSVTIDLTSTPAAYDAANHRLDLYVYDLSGNLMVAKTGNAQAKSAVLSLPAGVYVVRVHHSAQFPQPTTFTLTTS